MVASRDAEDFKLSATGRTDLGVAKSLHAEQTFRNVDRPDCLEAASTGAALSAQRRASIAPPWESLAYTFQDPVWPLSFARTPIANTIADGEHQFHREPGRRICQFDTVERKDSEITKRNSLLNLDF